MNENSIAKPLILISQRVDYLQSRNETRDSLDQALSRWVIAAKAIPVHLPNVLSEEMLMDFLAQLKPVGIILSGGNNIGEYSQRDQTESHLLDFAQLHNIPVLGICRGMQFIGFWSGSTLIPVKGHSAVRHEINGVFNATVNSYHDYVLSEVPKEFTPLAYAKDGHIEAMANNSDWSCEGWMWHPERETPFEQVWLARFRALMKLN